MEQQPQRAWYKKKRYIIPAIVLGIGAYSLAASNSSPSTTLYQAPQTTSIVQSFPTVTNQTIQNNNLSNNNYYTNTSGSSVHSPAYSNNIPVGASAQCRDGTYSFSQSRRGTCSHHGGVSNWLN
jgi:hypothetical protein